MPARRIVYGTNGAHDWPLRRDSCSSIPPPASASGNLHSFPAGRSFSGGRLFRMFAPSGYDDKKKGRRDDRADESNGRSIHFVSPLKPFRFEPGPERRIPNRRKSRSTLLSAQSLSSFRAFQIEFIMGSRSRTMRTTTGPTVMTNRDGRMKKKIGKTSFTLSCAAFSSARCRA